MKYRRDLPVLVVDDDAAVRELLRRILEKESYAVVEAQHGRAALERMGEQAPGAILLDLMMPVMNGWDFLSEFRQREGLHEVPVILLSGTGDVREQVGA